MVEGGVTKLTPITLGRREGPLRVITAGLKGDEQIAITNLKKIFYPGMPVKPVPGNMEKAEALPQPESAASIAQEPTEAAQ